MAWVPSHTYIKVKMDENKFDDFIKDIKRGFNKNGYIVKKKKIKRDCARFHNGFAYILFKYDDIFTTSAFAKAAIKNGEYSEDNVFIMEEMDNDLPTMLGVDSLWDNMPVYKFSFDKNKNICDVKQLFRYDNDPNSDPEEYHKQVYEVAKQMIDYGTLFDKKNDDEN